MSGRDIIVVGASAGGVTAVKELIKALPGDLPAAVFVVIHTSPNNPGGLPGLLRRKGGLSAEYAEDGEPIRNGHVYVARPDHHLLVKPGLVRTPRGPRENGFRPAVDPLFRTAAKAYGRRVIGVILSGSLDDGAYGMMLVSRAGGATMVQDPQQAMFDSMPRSVMANVKVDHVLPVADLASVIAGMAAVPELEDNTMSARNPEKKDVSELGDEALRSGKPLGKPTPYTCPECGGSLWEQNEENLARFVCHVGHSYSSESLVSDKSTALERALWSALRALEESAELRRRMAERARNGNMAAIAVGYQRQAHDAEIRAEVIRNALLREVAPEAR